MGRLNALRAFVRVVERGSVTGAAQALQVSQPTVSKWLAALEAELGVRLLDRTTRTRRLTEAGLRFFDDARDVLAAYDEALARARSSAGALAGRVRLSVPVVFGQRHITPLLGRFLDAHPAVTVEVVFSDAYVDLVGGGFDLAVRVGRPVDSTLRGRTLARTGRCLVAAPGYVATAGAPEVPGELAAHTCLLHAGVAAGTVWRFRKDDGWTTARVTGRFSANHSDTLRALAVAGHGVALLADWLVADDLAAGRLVRLLPGYAPPPAPVQALLPPGRRTAPRVQALVEHLAEGLAPLSDRGSE